VKGDLEEMRALRLKRTSPTAGSGLRSCLEPPPPSGTAEEGSEGREGEGGVEGREGQEREDRALGSEKEKQ
jgi:hypothetical protein